MFFSSADNLIYKFIKDGLTNSDTQLLQFCNLIKVVIRILYANIITFLQHSNHQQPFIHKLDKKQIANYKSIAHNKMNLCSKNLVISHLICRFAKYKSLLETDSKQRIYLKTKTL